MRFTGKLKTWNDDRGFGFITPSEGGQDIFVHVSDYPRGRVPTVDELLSFEVALNKQGKKKAVRLQLANASAAPASLGSTPRTTRGASRSRPQPKRNSVVTVLVVLAVLMMVIGAGYRYFTQTSEWAASPTLLEQQRRARAVGMPEPTRATFSCDGRTHCSQMTSCAEATFFLKNCPGTQMDGDGDGVPCEQQLCN